MLIAIAGNVIAQPGEADRRLAEQAAGLLGRQLAIAGHRIVVYSSEPDFLEPHIVSGYVASQRAQPESICVKYPREGGQIDFAERETHRSLFALQPDSSSDWEVSFYDSLYEVDGILLLGGGRSTLIAGLAAMGAGAAVLAIPSFGGHAQRVWNRVSKQDGLTEQDHGILATPSWNEDTAKAVVGVFQAYRDREAERRRIMQVEAVKLAAGTKWSALMAVVLFIIAAMFTLAAAIDPGLSIPSLIAMLVGGAPCAGVSGAAIRALAELGQGRLPKAVRPTYLTAALGMVAGILSAILIALPQLLAAARVPSAKAAILCGVIPSAVVTAFFAGFALDRFYRKLREVELKDMRVPLLRMEQ